MDTIQLTIPDSFGIDEKEAKMLLASQLYEKGKLSLGQAADFVGFSKRTFMEILINYNVSVINTPISDLDRDIKNAQDYSI